MRDLLRRLAANARDAAAGRVRDASSALYGTLWGVYWWIGDRERDVHWGIDWVGGQWWWQAIPGFGDLIPWAHDRASEAFRAVRRYPEEAIGWFNRHWDPTWGDWAWVAGIREAGHRLEDLAGVVGEWIDRIGPDPWRWVVSLLEPLMHHIGWAVGWVAQRIGELPANPFGDIIPAYPNWWDRLAAVFGRLAHEAGERLGRLWARVWDAFEGPLAAVGWALGELESILRGAPPNRWPEVRGSGAHLFWTIATMGHLVAGAAINRILATAQQTRDWAQALVTSSLSPVQGWIAQTNPWIEWLRANAQALSLILANPAALVAGALTASLWPAVEAWLADLWDGP